MRSIQHTLLPISYCISSKHHYITRHTEKRGKENDRKICAKKEYGEKHKHAIRRKYIIETPNNNSTLYNFFSNEFSLLFPSLLVYLYALSLIGRVNKLHIALGRVLQQQTGDRLAHISKFQCMCHVQQRKLHQSWRAILHLHNIFCSRSHTLHDENIRVCQRLFFPYRCGRAC